MAPAGVIAHDARAARSIDEAPPMREATEPIEARELQRDDVRLIVSDLARDTIDHAHFRDLRQILDEGDLLVVNTSGTLNAALSAETDAGEPLVLHLSTRLPGGFWVVELRQPGPVASLPHRGAWAGLTLRLPAGARATLLAPHPLVTSLDAESRLWLAALQVPDLTLADRVNHPRDGQRRIAADANINHGCSPKWGEPKITFLNRVQTPEATGSGAKHYLPEPLRRYLDRYGAPIRYSYVPRTWPTAMYQTVFATDPGSAEMPSAARPFTASLVTRLVARGIQIAPLTLHTGVASLEDHEPPYEEFYRVSPATADRVNATRRAGGRIIAVGTTAVRALETVTDARGVAHPGEGWTDLVITPSHPLRVVDSLVTGLHEPRATHLAILDRVIGDVSSSSSHDHLSRAYAEARADGYLWHEFGDAHLILGARGARATRRSTGRR